MPPRAPRIPGCGKPGLHAATNVFGLPFMGAELVREQRARPRDVSSLRTATVAGDVCPAPADPRNALTRVDRLAVTGGLYDHR